MTTFSRWMAAGAGLLLAGLVPGRAQLLPVLNPHAAVEALPRTSPFGASRSFIKTSMLQTWQYQVTDPVTGGVYDGSVVGGDPFKRGARTATIPVVVIPLRVQFSNGYNFDPTSKDDGILGVGNTALSLTLASDQFQLAPHTINGVNMGNTIFADAFQRASFWQNVQHFAPAYHLAFSVTQAATQTFSPGANGTVYRLSGSPSTNLSTMDNPANLLGVVDVSAMDARLNTIIANLNIQPNQFPLFVIYGVVMASSGSSIQNCCILGYHNGSGAPATPGQTYGIAEYDQGWIFGSGVRNTSTLSHELLEWVNDPSGANPTPVWGNIGQVSGSQNNLEVGDPLSGTLMPGVTMPNGVTYYSQELAFFSWFYGGAPYTGAGGKYSSNGTFTGYAKPDPPGGSY